MKTLYRNLPTCIDVDWDHAIEQHLQDLEQPPVIPYPQVYQLETTSLCNLQCGMCPRQQGMDRPQMIMEVDLFNIILDRDLRWTKAIELFGFGEPFTDPYLSERIKLLHDHGIYAVIATNGLLLENIPDHVIQDIDYLVFDVDALDADTYNSVRVGGDYSLMQANLERVLALRDKYTVLQFIQLGDTIDPQEFPDRYKGSTDEVRIKFFDSFAGQVADMEAQHGVCCLEPFYGVSIWSNGDVVLCDRDYNSKYKMGNIAEQSLMDIWMGDRSQVAKTLHRQHRGEEIELCSHCPEWRLTNLRNVPEFTVNMFKGDFI